MAVSWPVVRLDDRILSCHPLPIFRSIPINDVIFTILQLYKANNSYDNFKAWFTIWCWHRKCHEHCEHHRKKVFFHESNYILDVKFLDNLTGWTLANAGNTTLEKKLSLFQCHTNARDTTLAPVSYCVLWTQFVLPYFFTDRHNQNMHQSNTHTHTHTCAAVTCT